METNNTTSVYTLTVKETNNKAGKYHYKVVDEKGNVISERKSNRVYVAATIHGTFYFGRADLVGKGEHGRFLRDWAGNPERAKEYQSISNVAYLNTNQ